MLYSPGAKGGFMVKSFVLALALLAASPAQEGAPELRGSGWVNSKELSLERLRGKVVALYFFEEG
jgi:hypothetical protein